MLRKILFFIFSLSLLTSSFSLAWAGKLDQEVDELKRIQDTNNKTLADTVQAVTSLRQEMQELKGSLEELKHFFQEGSQKNDKMINEFDYRLTGMEERVTLLHEQMQDFLNKSQAPGKKGSKSEESEESLYKHALSDVNTQNYKVALQTFDKFLQKYPKSSLADNAQYWKGEAYFALKDFPNAVLEFQKVVKKYPKSDKVPGAILKQGYAFFEIKEYMDAKAFLQKVITEFPTSEAASSAKEKLQKVDQILAKGPVAPAPKK